METRSERPRTSRGAHFIGYLLLAAAFSYAAIEYWRRPLTVGDRPRIEPGRAAQVQARIDPNTASWAEFAQLPEIGESLAREIVAYREARRVEAGTGSEQTRIIFRSIKDLDSIPGMGLKTLERIEPYLRFPT